MHLKRLVTAVATAALLAAAPLAASAAEFINVLTGGTSGVYYPMGVAMSEIWGKGIAGARTQVQATKASVENLNLLQQGKGEVGFALGDSVQMAWEGNAEAGFKGKLDKIRALGAIYPNYIQIVAAKDAGIASLADLKGKSLSVGAAKSGTELNARAILAAAGMTYQDLGKVEYLPFAESVELMKNRQLDATLQSAGLGVASLKDLATSTPITVIPVPADLVGRLGAAYQTATIPAGTYQGQDGDVETAAVTNLLVTHEGVPEETVYQMTKLLFENLDSVKAAHAAGKAIDPARAAENLPIPLHPGAERYYREIGVLK